MTEDALYSDDESRWRAVVARDRAAAGRFFYGVTSTGICCRPGCASRRLLRKNVIFFKAMDDARAAGFRPCRRCGSA